MAKRKKTVTTTRTEARLFLAKAEQFAAEAATALKASRNDATLLNAVHAAISAADAICVALVGVRSVDPDHQRAVDLLEEVVGSREEEKRHLQQLKRLLAKMNVTEYESRQATAREARDGEAQARRFFSWARRLVADSGLG